MSISAASPSGSCTSPTSTPRRPSIDRGGRARGPATRFGGPKQTLLVPAVLQRLAKSPVDEVVVVAGAHELGEVEARVVVRPDWERGPRLAAVWPRRASARDRSRDVVLGDGPNLAPQAVERVLAAWRGRGDVVAAGYGGNRGHPLLLARAAWNAIPDEGTRGALPAILVPCDDLGTPGDVDTADDIGRLHPPLNGNEGDGVFAAWSRPPAPAPHHRGGRRTRRDGRRLLRSLEENRGGASARTPTRSPPPSCTRPRSASPSARLASSRAFPSARASSHRGGGAGGWPWKCRALAAGLALFLQPSLGRNESRAAIPPGPVEARTAEAAGALGDPGRRLQRHAGRQCRRERRQRRRRLAYRMGEVGNAKRRDYTKTLVYYPPGGEEIGRRLASELRSGRPRCRPGTTRSASSSSSAGSG